MDGFETAESFVAGFVDRPELKELIASARRRIEEGRAQSAQYKVTLAGLRRAAGLSQAELADRAGTYQPIISMIEGGRRTPTLEMIFAFAEALNVSFDILMPAIKP